MSSYLENKQLPASRKLCYSPVKKNNKRILKSKENIFKPKCSKALKKKLKKYKLRRDGNEDPDILDVSQILVTSLRIKSPKGQENICCNNNNNSNNNIEREGLNSTNYLIKMVRRKKCLETETFNFVKNGDTTNVNQNNINVLVDKEDNKQQMDAFKLMMDSRNKSLGTNSPGKEKPEQFEPEELLEKKENRAKRIVSLQRMAQSKGALQNKEIEEFRENCINKKLLKRAEKFKDMLTKTDCKSDKKLRVIETSKKQPGEIINSQGQPSVKSKTLKLCNIFDDSENLSEHPKPSKKISEEDNEFLKKLSPSLKKKENMLCYFKKISKEENSSLEGSEYDNVVESIEPVIKVKLQSKCRKKTKKMVSLKTLRENSSDINGEKVSCASKPNADKSCKRKRKAKVEESCLEPQEVNNLTNIDSNDSRPKRHVKKPIKYTEDVHIFSSDEELHIFTPKKKKINEKGSQTVKSEDIAKAESNYQAREKKVKILSKEGQNNKIKTHKKLVNQTKDEGSAKYDSKSSQLEFSKKKVKLAPIFATKVQLSAADIEAKQKFLQSGVPEKLKKKLHQSSNSTTFDMFPTVVHIQQSKLDLSSCQGRDWYKISGIGEELNDASSKYLFKDLLTLDEIHNLNLLPVQQKPEKILKNIKSSYPKFPVYRTYHLLRGKNQGEFKDYNYQNLENSIEIMNFCADLNNENPDKLSWCDKYKPTSSKHIIGNFESVKELKRWLETWTENLVKSKHNGSDSSDFSDFYHSDTDSRDAVRNTNIVLILTGGTGSGKTSTVYAVAAELAVKVIEVNASSKRTGKRVLQDLQEATQSHKVDRGKSGSEGSQKEVVTNGKKESKFKKNKTKQNSRMHLQLSQGTSSESSLNQTSASQESGKTGMSLILIDDADIVFEQDDGFCSAISQLIQTSKRPVILSTSSLSCAHLQRFIQNGKIIHMHPLLPRMLGTWLDIMCLADVGLCHTGLGERLLDINKGDMRKTINCLQFYMNSSKHLNQGEETAVSQVNYNFDDENSNISWADSESVDISNKIDYDLNIDKHLELLKPGCSLDMFNAWWSFLSNLRENKKTEDLKGISEDIIGIDKVAEILDTMSILDCYDQATTLTTNNIATKPWFVCETASLLENENFDCFNRSSIINKDIIEELLKKTILAGEKVLNLNRKATTQGPSIKTQRQRDKVVSRHIMLSSYLNPSAVLDRRAAALDYWSSCRAICKTEKNKTDSNTKRNNRFCHYLKSLNILCKNDYFDSLADSLS